MHSRAVQELFSTGRQSPNKVTNFDSLQTLIRSGRTAIKNGVRRGELSPALTENFAKETPQGAISSLKALLLWSRHRRLGCQERAFGDENMAARGNHITIHVLTRYSQTHEESSYWAQTFVEKGNGFPNTGRIQRDDLPHLLPTQVQTLGDEQMQTVPSSQYRTTSTPWPRWPRQRLLCMSSCLCNVALEKSLCIRNRAEIIILLVPK